MSLVQEACEADDPQIFIYEEPDKKCCYILTSFNILLLNIEWLHAKGRIEKIWPKLHLLLKLFVRDMKIGTHLLAAGT